MVCRDPFAGIESGLSTNPATRIVAIGAGSLHRSEAPAS
jgi:hypothetical protein